MVFGTFLILFGGAGILLSMATMWQMSDTYHALYGYSNEAETYLIAHGNNVATPILLISLCCLLLSVFWKRWKS